MIGLPHVLLMASLLAGTGIVQGQSVYKCTSPKGPVTYSHAPCSGAEIVDATPTQGLDRSSGQSRKGADVRRDELDRAMAEALKPLLGETKEQYQKRHRRSRLAMAAQAECSVLDRQLVSAENSSRQVSSKEQPSSEMQLLHLRQRAFELRC